MPRTYYQKNGYDVFVTIAGASVPRNQLMDSITISKIENEATIARLKLLPPAGVQSPESYQGASVLIDIRVAGGVYRAFTGVVDLPELDIINQTMTLNCTDNRDTRIKQLSLGYVQSIGVYSRAVFGDSKDVTEELQKRLSTIPYAFDFDNFGNPTLTPWAPKGTADITLQPNQIYYREPSVRFNSRIKTVNTIRMKFDYGYQRLHQKCLAYSWPGSYFSQFCTYWREGRPSFPTRDMIRSAANGVGWTVVGNINFVDLWPAQGFNCGGWIIWQPNQVSSEYQNKTDSSGNPVKDSSGNTVQQQSRVTITDTSSHLCRGATWFSRLRFTQNVFEKYSITMTAPQSIAKYGVVPTDESYTLNAEYDSSLWEKSTSDYYSTSNLYYNQDTERTESNAALVTMLNKARTQLLAVHRDVTVSFMTPIWPQVDLKHTVAVNTTPLECRGKVSRVEHSINIQTTEAFTRVELQLSRSQGSASNSALTIPPIPSEDPSYIGTSQTIVLQSHYGEDPTSTRAAEWNGHIANKQIEGTQQQAGYRTQFQEVFIVDSPKIPDIVRNNRELPVSQSYTVAIPNDPLIVRF